MKGGRDDIVELKAANSQTWQGTQHLLWGWKWSRGGLRDLWAPWRLSSCLGAYVGVEEGVRGWGKVQPWAEQWPCPHGRGTSLAPRRVTGGSSRRGGIPPSSSRPADESPCRRGSQSARPPLAQLCSSPLADVRRHPPRPRHGPKTNDSPRGTGGTARGNPRAPGFAHLFIHPSSLRRETWCHSYMASLWNPSKVCMLLPPPVAKRSAASEQGFSGSFLFNDLKMRVRLYSDGPGPQSAQYLPPSLTSQDWDHARDMGSPDCLGMTMGIL